MFTFDLVRGPVVRDLLFASRSDVVDIVESAYLAHYSGKSANPRSHFLHLPGKPNSRIIALPAYIGSKHDVAGIKWIASFPDNIAWNVPRASAVLILNDYETGYPIACLEASQISAARTAASATLGAEHLSGGRTVEQVLVVGAGVLGRTVVDYFAARDWEVGTFLVTDHVPEYAESLRTHIEGLGYRAAVTTNADKAMAKADLVVFVTTMSEPWVFDPSTFSPGQTVLDVSLRDLAPEILWDAHNIVDDIDHVLNANTSAHLTEQYYGDRGFIDGTLAGLMSGDIKLTDDRPKIFSPFGLGILDLAVGRHIHLNAADQGLTMAVPDFFGETERWT